MPFAVSPVDKNEALFTTDYAIIKTNDGGVNYNYSGSGFNGACAQCFYFYPDSSKLIGYNDFGLYQVSKDDVFTPIGGISGSVLAVDAYGDYIGALALINGTTYRFYYSKDKGGSFSYINLDASGVYRIVKFLNNDSVVVGTTICDNFSSSTPTFTHQTGFTYYPMYHDGSQFWGWASGSSITLYASTTAKNSSWATNYITASVSIATADVNTGALVVDNTNTSAPRAYIASLYSFYRSNGASAWESFGSTNSVGLDIDYYGALCGKRIAISKNDNRVLLLGKYSLNGSSNGAFLSKNKSATWRQANIDGINNLKIEGVGHNKYDDCFYVGTYRGTFKITP